MVISIPDEGSTGHRHRGNDKGMTEHKVTAVDTTIPTPLLLLLFCVHRYISDRDSLCSPLKLLKYRVIYV